MNPIENRVRRLAFHHWAVLCITLLAGCGANEPTAGQPPDDGSPRKTTKELPAEAPKIRWTNPPNGTFKGILKVPIELDTTLVKCKGSYDVNLVIETKSIDPPIYHLTADAVLPVVGSQRIADVTIKIDGSGASANGECCLVRTVEDSVGGTIFNTKQGVGFAGQIPEIGDLTIFFGSGGAVIVYKGSGAQRCKDPLFSGILKKE